jgi:protein-disulfide isomerase
MLLTLSSVAYAQTKTCDALSGEARKVALELLKSQHAYDCCDKSLFQCLEKKPTCTLVKRLSDDICRRVSKGQSRADIERELSRRATSMMPTGKQYVIDTKSTSVAGSNDGKVTLAVYLCPRCPFCATLLPGLYESVTKGRLAGKVKLVARPFPVRAHPGSTEAGLGLMAANPLGKFWEFLLELYRDFDHFDAAHVDDLAVKVGLERAAFNEKTKDAAVRAALVEAKKEGVRNAVESTPTFFINGRKYTGEMTQATLEDVLLEEYERVTGKTKE